MCAGGMGGLDAGVCVCVPWSAQDFILAFHCMGSEDPNQAAGLGSTFS